MFKNANLKFLTKTYWLTLCQSVRPAIPPTSQDGNSKNVDVKVSETNG